MSNIDVEILRSFYENPDNYFSGEDIARKLGLSRTAIWSHIQELKAAGLPIEAVPNLGYKLLGQSPNLIAADIKAQLNTRIIGREVLVFQETDSTQRIVEQFARDGVAEGLVVFAENQKQGKGRLGRKWVSPAKSGLWFSTLLRPGWRPDKVTRLTVLAAVAIMRAIENETGLEIEIKYPNDLMIKGRKLCGILAEMLTEVDYVQYVVLGIGINVNTLLSDYPDEIQPIVTSLRIATGEIFGRSLLAAKVLSSLDHVYREVQNKGFSTIAEEWSDRCSTLGKKITAIFGNEKVRGTAIAIDEEGALVIQMDDGTIKTLRGGDITLEKE